MIPKRLANGNILVPVAYNDEHICLDGAREVTPEDPDFSLWEEEAIRYEQVIERARSLHAASPPAPATPAD